MTSKSKKVKVGDKIKVTKDTCYHQFPIGETLTVTQVSADGGIRAENALGRGRALSPGNFKKVKPLKYPVGTQVTVTGDEHTTILGRVGAHQFEPGTQGEVVQSDLGLKGYRRVKSEDMEWSVHIKDLKKAEVKLKEGDQVIMDKVCLIDSKQPVGKVGTFVRKDKSSVPYLVQYEGERYWCTEVTKVSEEPVVKAEDLKKSDQVKFREGAKSFLGASIDTGWTTVDMVNTLPTDNVGVLRSDGEFLSLSIADIIEHKPANSLKYKEGDTVHAGKAITGRLWETTAKVLRVDTSDTDYLYLLKGEDDAGGAWFRADQVSDPKELEEDPTFEPGTKLEVVVDGEDSKYWHAYRKGTIVEVVKHRDPVHGRPAGYSVKGESRDQFLIPEDLAVPKPKVSDFPVGSKVIIGPGASYTRLNTGAQVEVLTPDPDDFVRVLYLDSYTRGHIQFICPEDLTLVTGD